MQASADASYILNFFADIKQLTDYLAAYSNALLAIKIKIGSKENNPINESLVITAISEKRLTEEEVKQANTLALNIRYWVTQIYIKFMGLKDKIKEIENKEKDLKRLYRKIQQSPYPVFDEIEEFTILTHQLFSTSALSEMLVKDKEYYEQLSGFNEPIGEQEQTK